MSEPRYLTGDGPSIIDLYFQQIKDIPLLDAGEEVSLFQQYRDSRKDLSHIFYFGQVLYEILVSMHHILYENARVFSIFEGYDIRVKDAGKEALLPLARVYQQLNQMYKLLKNAPRASANKELRERAYNRVHKLPWKTPVLLDWAEKIIGLRKKYQDMPQVRSFILMNSFLPAEDFLSLAEKVGRARTSLSSVEEILCTSNLKLVISVAKKYQHLGQPLEDLIQEGNMGLLTAIARFDLDRKYRFSTYAIWWIKQAIIQSLFSQTRTIRIPAHIIKFYNRMLQYSSKYLQSTGQEPSVRDISEHFDMPQNKILQMLRTIQRPLSLSMPMDSDSESTLDTFIADPQAANPSDSLQGDSTRKQLLNIIQDYLTPREKEVITLRFGLKAGSRKTLDEVARELVITRERVRQIEKKALNKLRKPSQKKALNQFLSDPVGAGTNTWAEA
jgi:RNA polymerase primary sigma factor